MLLELNACLRENLKGKLIEIVVKGTTVRTTVEITEVYRITLPVRFQRVQKFIASKLHSYELSIKMEAVEN